MFRRLAIHSFSTVPLKVAITGGSGQIAYSLLFRIASGSLFGPTQPVVLQILDQSSMQRALRGVVMELYDSAFPLVHDIIASDIESFVFSEADYCFMVGSKPRGPGMERVDLLQQNGEIFQRQGESLNKYAKNTAKVVVVGNPANTNCLILSSHCPNIPKENFTAMTRLDHNRAVSQLAQYTGTHVSSIEKLCVWGNHSSTMYPDIASALVAGVPAKSKVPSQWAGNEFLRTVQQRGAAIIEARKTSSAASAASAALDHMRDWVFGSDGKWVSMSVPSELGREYGVPPGLIFSFPVTTVNGAYCVVPGLQLDKEKLAATTEELLSERESIRDLLRTN